LRTREKLGLPKWAAVVEGSFDDPPIVLRQDRLKLSLMSLALAALLGLVLWLPVRAYTPSHLIVLACVAIGLVFHVLQALRPTTLVLDPNGLEVRFAFRTLDVPWPDVARFRLQRRPYRAVVGEPSERCVARQSGWRRLLIGPQDLGSVWELPAQRVVDILNEALRRWGQDSASPQSPPTAPRFNPP
jgi:hypothetical protein